MPGSILDPLGHPSARDGDGDGRVHDGETEEHGLPSAAHAAIMPIRPIHAPAVMAPAAGPPAAEPEFRDFGDARAIRASIYDGVLEAAGSMKPVVNARHTLEVARPFYDGPGDFSLAAQKRAVLDGASLGRRLRGTYVLKDTATGEVLDRKTSTLATVPYFTPRGTFIRNGTEYTLSSQLRLKPAIYTRRKDNGELESHVNVRPGAGMSHRIFLEPETGRFRLGLGQAKMPLIPLLRAMGASDSRLREAWGRDVAHANMLHDDPTVVDKLARRLVRNEAGIEPGGRMAAVKAAFEAMPLDPEVNAATLGQPHGAVTLDALLDATRKLLAVNKGEAGVDDRDNLAFMTLHGPEDLISERVGRDRMVLGKALWKVSRQGHLGSMPPNLLTRGIDSAIMSSGLGAPGEMINPLMIYEQQGRISRMGEGGIPSLDSVPADSRNVQPSHFGFLDPLTTPESLRVGVDSRIASLAKKGTDGQVYSQAFRDRFGRPLTLTPAQAARRTIAFAGELATGADLINVMQAGKTRTVPREQVDAEMAHAQHTYSPITNLVPMFSAVKPQRAVMAGRMLTQALPLQHAESPHVQSGIPDGGGRSYEHKLGEQMGAVRAAKPGVVEAVDDKGIHVAHDDGTRQTHELYINHAFNRKTGLNQTPTVRVGQRVGKDDLLAKSNYTDDHGVTALGVNARVAYVPLDGRNFEDAIAVSESFARDRMKSEHYYQHYVEHHRDLKVSKKAHSAIFPGKYDRAVTDNFDDDGVIRPGTHVSYDHPLILAAKKRDRTHGSIHKGRDASFTDATEAWKHHSTGLVTDVAKTAKGVQVTVKAFAPMEIGDKMSGRFGDKGVVARIVPDHEMPRDKDGVPYEVAMNPLGTISRTNPAQHVEGALGKIAARTGKKYSVVDFDKAQIPDLTAYAQQELAAHGMHPDSTEPVFDPVKQRWVKDPFTGAHPQTANRFVMKLHHTSESKSQGRGMGGYSAEGTPAKGGENGSKRLSLMDINALLSHGATEVIRDAGIVRGQAQPELWAQFMAGHAMPMVKEPHVHQKFYAQLKAAGIHPVREGTRTQLMALDDAAVNHLAGNRNLEHADTVDWKDGMKPVKGGLFDQALTGGHAGDRWSAIRLHEPMVNPVMEEPARRMLGLTEAKFRAILGGTAPLGDHGTGPRAIKSALSAIDVDKEEAQARGDVKSGKKGLRDEAVRRLRFLAGAKAQGLHPRDWVLDRVPVLPPKFRPVSVMQGSGLPMIADPNLLYKELFDANENLKQMDGQLDDLSEERHAVYDAFRGVVGLGEPLHPKNQERQVKGILKQVFGNSPKTGMVQRKLLGSTVDLVGRSVITPDPDLDIDSVGVPENRAWDVYRPFIVRRLVRDGVPRLHALRAVQDRIDLARSALVKEMDARPVIVTRAPVLHKYGVMAFRPRLVPGETLQLPPLVYKGFGADNDGDQQYDHVICAISATDLEALVRQCADVAKVFEEHRMAARFKEHIPTVIDGDIYVFHLEDFPHGARTHTSRGQFGLIDWYKVPAGVKVLSQDAEGELVWTAATAWSKHHDCPVQVAHLASGRTIYTDDDPRAVYGIPAGTLGFARATPQKAAERCFLVPRMSRLEGHPLVDDVETLDVIATDGHARLDSHCRLKAEIALDGDFGYLVGCTAGDGWATSNEKDVCIAGISWPIIAKLDAIIPTLFAGRDPQRCTVESAESYGESRRHTYTSREFATFVATLVGRGAALKHLPPWFLRTSREFRSGLLAGLMDTDGTVAIGRSKAAPQLITNYTSSSLRLCQEVRLLAATLGIRGRITPTKTPAGKPHWLLTLSNYDFQAWGGVGMQHPEKLARMAEVPVVVTPALIRHDLVPISTELAKACRSAIGMPKVKANRRPGQVSLYCAFHDAVGRGYVTRDAAGKFFEFIDINDIAAFDSIPGWELWWMLVANTDVTWDLVESWEDAGMTLTGYDLTVPGHETFANVDGVILSNTVSWHVPAADEAVADAYEKMLPSKNLLSISEFKAHQLPSQEFVGGLFTASSAYDNKSKPRVFATRADAVKAYHRGEVGVDQPVHIINHEE